MQVVGKIVLCASFGELVGPCCLCLLISSGVFFNPIAMGVCCWWVEASSSCVFLTMQLLWHLGRTVTLVFGDPRLLMHCLVQASVENT